MYTIGQFSIMTKIPKKTLRYYDEIELLKPAQIDFDNNYRYYDENSLLTAQQILIYRSCKVPLERIKEIINQPHNKNDLKQILKSQFDFLQQEMTEMQNSQSVLKNIIVSLEDREVSIITDSVHEKATVLSIRRFGNHNMIGEIISELFETSSQNGLKVLGSHTIVWHTDKDFTDELVDMEIYIPVENSVVNNLQNIKIKEKQRYCEIEHNGSMATLSSSYAKLFSFIEKNELIITGSFEEAFISDKKYFDPENLKIVILVPVKEELQ